MHAKLSISISDEASQLLQAMAREENEKPSRLIDHAIRQYAYRRGYKLIPARVVRTNEPQGAA